jgi:pimeloyl-ACP methyl ester carboxylesterase
MERVALVHGFTQTSASWGPVAERLARRFEVVPVDLPGHGGSGAVRVGFAEAAGLAGPLFATLPAEAAGRQERLANTAEGLASALRRLGTGAQEPLWDRLGQLRPPALLVAGERDPKFAGTAMEMAAAIGPAAQVALVPGAGHAAHLERPAATAALIEEFLGRPA